MKFILAFVFLCLCFVTPVLAESKGTFSRVGGGAVEAVTQTAAPGDSTDTNNQQIAKVFGGLVVAGIASAVAIFLTLTIALIFALKILWNLTFPQLFGVKEVTFWQMLRIWLFVALLLGGWPLVEIGQQGLTVNFGSRSNSDK